MRIIDSHVHLDRHNPRKAIEMADHFGYEKFALMAIPCQGDPLNTLESLLKGELKRSELQRNAANILGFLIPH